MAFRQYLHLYSIIYSTSSRLITSLSPLPHLTILTVITMSEKLREFIDLPREFVKEGTQVSFGVEIRDNPNIARSGERGEMKWGDGMGDVRDVQFNRQGVGLCGVGVQDTF